jgi:hypothetical protein
LLEHFLFEAPQLIAVQLGQGGQLLFAKVGENEALEASIDGVMFPLDQSGGSGPVDQFDGRVMAKLQ